METTTAQSAQPRRPHTTRKQRDLALRLWLTKHRRNCAAVARELQLPERLVRHWRARDHWDERAWDEFATLRPEMAQAALVESEAATYDAIARARELIAHPDPSVALAAIQAHAQLVRQLGIRPAIADHDSSAPVPIPHRVSAAPALDARAAFEAEQRRRG